MTKTAAVPKVPEIKYSHIIVARSADLPFSEAFHAQKSQIVGNARTGKRKAVNGDIGSNTATNTGNASQHNTLIADGKGLICSVDVLSPVVEET